MARVLIVLAQGCEEMEAVAIIDILRRAGVVVVSAGLDDALIHASRGTVLQADTTLDAVLHEVFDMVVLPGGQPGTRHLDADERIHDLLRRTVQQGHYVAAICAAPMVLAHAGLLDGKRVTAYPGTLEALNIREVCSTGAAVEQDGKLITSRGPGTAMDFSLHLIECLVGRAKRDEVDAALVRG